MTVAEAGLPRVGGTLFQKLMTWQLIFSLSVMAAMLIVFPADFLVGIHVKTIALALICLSALVAATVADCWPSRTYLFAGMAVIACAGMLVLLSQLSGLIDSDLVIRSLQLIVTTIVIPLIVLTIQSMHRRISPALVIKLCILGCCAYAVGKLFLEAVLVSNTVPFLVFDLALRAILDMTPVTGMIGSGLFRMQYPADMVCTVMLIFLFPHVSPHVRMHPVLRVIAALLLASAIILSWSRYVMVMACVIAFAAAFTMGPRVRIALMGVLVAGFVGILAVDAEDVMKAIGERLSSSSTESSDTIRVLQSRALLDRIADSPVVGFGPGAFTAALVRAPEQPFTYEVQGLSLLLQFGFLGGGLMVLALGYLGNNFLRLGSSGGAAVLLLTFVFFVVGGFTNPYLISSTMSMAWLALIEASLSPTPEIGA